MTRVAWTTDTHFDHSNDKARSRLVDEVVTSRVEALIVTGDISGGSSLIQWLDWLDDVLDIPLWFVLGNHDYYGSNIDQVRNDLMEWFESTKPARGWRVWLRNEPLFPTDKTAVIGTDGWYDARFGKLDGTVALNDFFYIHDLRPFHNVMAGPKADSFLIPKLREIADEEVRILEPMLDQALAQRDKILVVTHVPPFADAAWHKGSRSDVNFLPFFSCRSMGEMLVGRMEKHPDKEMLVLCGHTHGSGVFRPLSNLKVETGGAVYGSPALCGIVEV